VPLRDAPPAARDAGTGPGEPGDLNTGSTAPDATGRSLERALGHQIRAIRRRQDLSVSDLASAAGMSNGMLSKIENGAITASLHSLQAISNVLKVSLSSLFASFEERHDCSYVPAGQGVSIERRGTKIGHGYQLLGHLLRGDVVIEPYLITLQNDATPHTTFSHAGLEFIYMLSGTVTYRHGAKSYPLAPGDALLFDSDTQHGPELVGPGETSYLSIIVYPRTGA